MTEHILESMLRIIVGSSPPAYKVWCKCGRNMIASTPEDALAKFTEHNPAPWEELTSV